MYDYQPTPRQVSQDIQKRLLTIDSEFIKTFERVYADLVEMQAGMDRISDESYKLQTNLRQAYDNASTLLNKKKELENQQRVCATKQLILERFLKRFALEEQMIKALTQPNEPISNQFFDSLDHLQKIHKDCQILLIVQDQTLGLEIMDRLNSYQEIAYERLFKWTQHECRLLNNESPEVPSTLKRAMHAFRVRPILFDSCVDEIASIRNIAISKAFTNALTVGGPNGFPKPIEFHAHDSMRYAGDILAWVHQACIGERELLEGVFGMASKADRRRSVVTIPEAFASVEGYKATEEQVLKVLDKNTRGLSPIVSQRLDSLFASTLGCLTSFKISNMFQFYIDTIVSLLGEKAELSQTLQRIGQASVTAFFEALDSQAQDLSRSHPEIPPSLESPLIVRDSIAQLKEILVSYDMSLTNGKDKDVTYLEKVFNSFIEPLYDICIQAAADLDRLDGSIFLVNCYHLIQTSLSAFSYTDSHIRKLELLVNDQIGALVEEQYRSMMALAGLGSLHTAMEIVEGPLGIDPRTDKNAVAKAMTTLGRFLLEVNMDVTENLYRIQSVDIAKRVASKGRALFLKSYKEIVSKLQDPENGYGEIQFRPVSELALLLSDDS